MPFNQFSLLAQRKFLPLFITQFLGAFNDNVFKNAVVILITYRLAAQTTWNPQILVTFAAGIFILPFFLFSATAGQLADKYEKSKLIPIIKFAEIILMLAAAWGFYLQNVAILMTVLFMLGVQATFFGPLKYAILPELLKESELIAGNGLVEAGTFLAILLGTILGGVLILYSTGMHFIVMSIILIAILGFISSLFVPLTHHSNSPLKINYNLINETWRVFGFAREQKAIFISILGISWFWLVGATYLAELPVFTKDILHADQNVVTTFFAIFAIGIGVGSLLCNKLTKGNIVATYVPMGGFGITLFTLLLYFAAKNVHSTDESNLVTLPQFLNTLVGWEIMLYLFLSSVCGGIYTVPLYAMLQRLSKPAHRARVIASNNVVNALFMVIAAFGTMGMLKLGFSVNEVFLTLAIANTFVAIYLCKLLPVKPLKKLLKF